MTQSTISTFWFALFWVHAVADSLGKGKIPATLLYAISRPEYLTACDFMLCTVHDVSLHALNSAQCAQACGPQVHLMPVPWCQILLESIARLVQPATHTVHTAHRRLCADTCCFSAHLCLLEAAIQSNSWLCTVCCLQNAKHTTCCK